MHLSALLDEGLGDERAELQVEPGRKEPTHFAVMVGISSLEKDKQGRQSVEILPRSPRQGRGRSQPLGQPSWWFPAYVGRGGELWGAVLSPRRDKYGQAGQVFLHPGKFCLPETPAKLM